MEIVVGSGLRLAPAEQAAVDAAAAAEHANADLYGDAVDHGSPLTVAPSSVPKLIANRLELAR